MGNGRGTARTREGVNKSTQLLVFNGTRLFRRHFPDHSNHQLAVAIVQAGRIAADLSEETELVVGKLGEGLRSVAVSRLRKKMRQRKLHSAGNLRQRVQRRH